MLGENHGRISAWPDHKCPPSSLASPRGAGAGVEVGTLRGREVPVNENVSKLVAWFLGFLVPWFLGFLVSWFQVSKFQSLEVSEFQSFNDSILPKFHFMFSGRSRSHIQDFRRNIRRIFVIFRIRLFQYFQNCELSNFLDCKK